MRPLGREVAGLVACRQAYFLGELAAEPVEAFKGMMGISSTRGGSRPASP